MTISMYQASVPTFTRMLTNLSGLLDKAAAYSEAKKIDPKVLLETRLFPDMFSLTRQIQIVSDTAKGAGARLAGLEPPKYEDNESTVPELTARINKTMDFLHSLRPEQIDGSEEKTIVLQLGANSVTFQGMNYLLGFALPNFYFHVTAAYCILRSCGVDVGKRDFLGKIF